MARFDYRRRRQMPALDPNRVIRELRDYVRGELIGNPSYPLGDDEPLITGGLIDSFCIAHLAVFVEGAFGVYVPDTDLTVENMDTLARIAETVGRAAGGGPP
jgi:acyl carrier protein